MSRKPSGVWLSVSQYAAEFGYDRSTVSRWVGQLERDTRLTYEQRISIVIGPRRARRIHKLRFAVWLDSLPRETQREKQAMTFVYKIPVMQ